VDAEVKACRRGALIAAFVVGSWSVPVHAQVDLEQKVKAAFLFNFLKFVTWPQARAPADREPYVMCVIGDEDFTRTLDVAVHGKTVSGHPVQVQDRAPGAPLTACHVAYLAPHPSAPPSESALSSAAGAGVLTVHEIGAAVHAGVIRFFLDDQRVRFEINTAAAERENLHLSSRLMELAERVQVTTP
jgi:hypothetical protein